MLKVGLTGGMGSGKSLICEVFSALGVPVFNADTESKALYDTDSTLRKQLIQLLGEEIYKEGVLQRHVMARKIFEDEALLKKVNALVHPVLKNKFTDWAGQQKKPYVLQEAAILFESGFTDCVDKSITVSAPESLRIQRVAVRNGWPEHEIRQRIARQWTDEQREALADFVIMNNGVQPVLPQVMEIHKRLLRESLSSMGSM